MYENKIEKRADNYMYGDQGKWAKESNNNNRLKYSIPTSGGQSGSPVYIKKA